MNNSKGDNIITDFINKEIDREIDVVESGVDIEFQKYCKMYISECDIEIFFILGIFFDHFFLRFQFFFVHFVECTNILGI